MPSPEPFDDDANRRRVEFLRHRGVEVWGPERVFVAGDVPLENIEPGCAIYHATLRGPELRIGRGTRIGRGGHALVENCQIGREVELGAGSYQNATILDRARVRGWAELRAGALLEEDVEAAHNAAFKNTVLTATVVTGSLINYCDIFMSGGTSRIDHSEVGSGVVHFNFDPRGDKWGSLIGGVRGVLLRSAPVFVGGQCGIVGPVHIDFGAVISAGSVVRRSVGPDCVFSSGADKGLSARFDREIYTGLKRKVLTTATLIGNLHALRRWYEQVRLPTAASHERPLYEAGLRQIDRHIEERIHRIDKIVEKLPRSIEKSEASGDSRLKSCHEEHRLLILRRTKISAALADMPPDAGPPPRALEEWSRLRASAGHVESLQALSRQSADVFQAWLADLSNATFKKLEPLLSQS